MALKDLRDYYYKVCRDRAEAIREIQEFEVECSNGLVSPERLDAYKKSLQPILTNYEQISYLMFLLDKPVKKEKHQRYANQNKKLLKQIREENTTEGMLNKNKQALEEMKNFRG